MKKIIPLALLVSLALASCDSGGSTPADSTPPSVSLSGTQGGQAVTLTATATDASPITKVEFYRGTSTTPFSTDTTAPYNATYSVSSADNGSVGFTAKAYDSAGNVGQADTAVNVYVAPSTAKTLYQGLWLWATLNEKGDVTRAGLTYFDEEFKGTYGLNAIGLYAELSDPNNVDSTLSPKGFSTLGPATAPNLLQARFWKGQTEADAKLDILADDDNNRMESMEDGSAFFYDDDGEIKNDDGSISVVAFGMSQLTDEVVSAASLPSSKGPVELPAAALKRLSALSKPGLAGRARQEMALKSILGQMQLELQR